MRRAGLESERAFYLCFIYRLAYYVATRSASPPKISDAGASPDRQPTTRCSLHALRTHYRHQAIRMLHLAILPGNSAESAHPATRSPRIPETDSTRRAFLNSSHLSTPKFFAILMIGNWHGCCRSILSLHLLTLYVVMVSVV